MPIIVVRSAEFTQLHVLQAAADQLREWFGPSSGVGVSPIDGRRPMFPEEEAHVQRAVSRRRDEFSTGRWCARQALAELGEPFGPIPVGPLRNPVWPEGFTGSISHTDGGCAAVVARCAAWKAVGIDLLDRDAAATLPAGAGRFLTHRHEDLAASASAPAWVPPLALLFSAKEAAIKALSPWLQRFVDFHEIRLQFDEGAFTATLDGAEMKVAGWWTTVLDKLIVTGAAMNAKTAKTAKS